LNHIVIIVLDSCRYDSFVESKSRFLLSLPTAPELRYSYASWTAPSHYNLMMGLMPHLNPINTYASELYTKEFKLWSDRIGLPLLDIKNFLPSLWLPLLLQSLGYETHGRVSMPVLNPNTPINRGFDDYKLVADHNSLEAILNEVTFGENPQFWLINTGETHYPYMLKDPNLPIVSGVHGAVKRLGSNCELGDVASDFPEDKMRFLHNAQRRAVKYVDRLISDFVKKMPQNTHIIVTADHGELFGENGFFGHGPICHPIVNQVPYLEFQRNQIIL
jgi:hypothetical protein